MLGRRAMKSPVDVNQIRRPPMPSSGVPGAALLAWLGRSLEAGVLWASFALLCGGFVGYVLAVVGLFHWLPVVTGAVAGGYLSLRLTLRSTPPHSAYRATPVVAVLAIAVATTALSVAHPGEHMWTGRDAATYLATAGWLAETGHLIVDARIGPFVDLPELTFSVPGFYDERADGRLAPEFMHSFPVLLAAVGQLTGVGGMLALNPLIGGLAIISTFVLASRLGGSWIGLVAATLLAINPVFTYFTRVPFTEPLALLYLTAGCWLLIAKQDGDQRTALVAGMLLGGTVAARIDSLLIVIPLLVLAVLGGDRTRAATRPVLRGYLQVAGLAVVLSLLISPWYIGKLDSQLLLIGLGVLAVLGLWVLPTATRSRIRSLLYDHKTSLAMATVVIGAAAFLFVLLIRPRLPPGVGGSYGLAALQEASDVPIDPTRSYAELSAEWLLWYLGPVALALGVGGLLLFGHQVIERKQDRSAALWWMITLFISAAYLWRPSINPDHIWAMRRFLPVAIPGLAIGAGLALRWVAGHGTPKRLVSAWVAGVMAIAGVGVAYLDLWELRELKGLSADFQEGCELVGADAAVLVVDVEGYPGLNILQSFRSYCQVPAAAVDASAAVNIDLETLSSDWREAGRSLFLIGAEGDLADLGVTPEGKLFTDQYPLLEYTLLRRPSTTSLLHNETSFGRVVSSDSS